MRQNKIKLKVEPLFYRDFSRYIRRMSIKHVAGVDDISRTVLSKIKDTKLTKQDIENLLAFNNRTIRSHVFANGTIPLRDKYRMIIKNKLYHPEVIEKFFSEYAWKKKDTRVKVRSQMLRHWNKLFENDRANFQDASDVFETMIVIGDTKQMPDLPLVQYMITKGWLDEDRRYSYRQWSYEGLACDINSVHVMDHIKGFLQDDIKTNTYRISSKVLSKMNKLAENEERDKLNELKPMIAYMLTDILPKISYKKKEYGDVGPCKLIEELIKAQADDLITEDQVKEALTRVDVSKVDVKTEDEDANTNVVVFLIEQLQKLNKQGGRK